MDIKDLRSQVKKRKKARLFIFATFMFFVVIGSMTFNMLNTGIEVEQSTLALSSVQQGDFSEKIVASGQFKASTKTIISAPYSGQVMSIKIRPSQEVSAGTPLLELQNKGLEKDFRELQLNAQNVQLENEYLLTEMHLDFIKQKQYLQESQGELQIHKARFLAQEKLAEKDIVSEMELMETKVKLDVLSKQIDVFQETLSVTAELIHKKEALLDLTNESATQDLLAAKEAVESLKVDADVAGVIQDISVQLGAFVERGMPLATLIRLDDMMFVAQVPERQASAIKLNDQATIYSGQLKVDGVVQEISPKVTNGMVEVVLHLTASETLDIRQDLSAQVEIVVSTFQNALYVRQPLYSQADAEGEVWVKNEQKHLLNRREVQFGKLSGQNIQVLSGLKKGEQIVTSNTVKNWKDQFSIKLIP